MASLQFHFLFQLRFRSIVACRLAPFEERAGDGLSKLSALLEDVVRGNVLVPDRLRDDFYLHAIEHVLDASHRLAAPAEGAEGSADEVLRPQADEIGHHVGDCGVELVVQRRATDDDRARELMVLRGHGGSKITSVEFSANGRTIVTGDAKGKSIVWLSAGWEADKPAEGNNTAAD